MKNFVLLTIIAFGSCALLPNLGCHKESDCPPDLPCATQTGENTFGCYINGKAWVSGIAPYLLDPTLHEFEVSYDEPDYGLDYNNFLYFSASRVDSFSYDFISMTFRPVLNEGNIMHNSFDIFRITTRLKTAPNSPHEYQIDTLSSYEMQLTKLDMGKNIVSGKFAFTAISSDFGDSIVVTNGRFDLKYDPY